MLSRGQKGDPHREPPFLSSHSADIVFPDQRVAAVLQHRGCIPPGVVAAGVFVAAAAAAAAVVFRLLVAAVADL